MQGIYVKDMKMPEYCLLCPFEHLMTCSREERYTDIHARRRPEWCPLIEITEVPCLLYGEGVWTKNGVTVNGEKAVLPVNDQEEK